MEKELEAILDTIGTVKRRLAELTDNDLVSDIGAKEAYELLSAAESALLFDPML